MRGAGWNGTSTAYYFDAASRLNVIAHDPPGSAGYSSENLLTGTAAGKWTMTFGYDPLMRYAAEAGGGLPRSYAYDGDDMLVTNRNGAFLVRFVHGPGESEPLYQLDNLGRRYWYHADERGSIVAASDAAGTVAPSSVVRYDEYGEAPSGSWTFGYTGGFWLPLGRQWLLRARVYDPALGRFLQPDPIGYGDGLNMYAYVGGDPVNATDPSGLGPEDAAPPSGPIVVTGRRGVTVSDEGWKQWADLRDQEMARAQEERTPRIQLAIRRAVCQ